MTALEIALILSGAVILIVLSALFFYFSNNCLKVTKYAVESEKTEGSVRVVHLSDLHGKRFGKGNSRLAKKVAALHPDIIAFTGDIVHCYTKKNIEVAAEAVEALKKVAPFYYVSGNHEMRSKEYKFLREKLVESGAVVLEDEAVEVCGITVAGVNCAHIKGGKFFSLAQGDGFKLLLAHLPHYIERYAMAGYDLTLCGHAHGGQWRIPFTKIGIYAPGQGLFPKYSEGMHSCGNMRQVISRGLGNSQFPLRLFNRPEIVVVDIIKK